MDPDTITGNVITGVILLVIGAAAVPLRRFVVRIAKAAWKFIARVASLRLVSSSTYRDLVRRANTRARRQTATLTAKHDREIAALTEAVQRAQREAGDAVGSVDHDMEVLRHQHEIEKEEAAREHSDRVRRNYNLGIELGREIERYGDDWVNLTPQQRRGRQREVRERQIQQLGLKRTITELHGRMSADQDEHRAALREHYVAGLEAGRRQGAAAANDRHGNPPQLAR